MTKAIKISIASMILGFIGFFGIIAYFAYIFSFDWSNLLNPEIIGNEELFEEVFFKSFFRIAIALFFGFSALGLCVLGIATGIYGAIKTRIGNRGFQFALTGIIIGIIGLILAVVMANVYFVTTYGDFLDYFYSHF